MGKRILFIRSFKFLAAGGPVPPLGLLYIASCIRRAFTDRYQLKLLDTGIGNLSIEDVRKEVEQFSPHMVGLSTLTCEADLMHAIARVVKEVNRDMLVLAGGPHPTVAYQYTLQDENIDYAIVGEGERTITEFLKVLEKHGDLSRVNGLAYRADDEVVCTKRREYIEELDELPFPAWDLIDIKAYVKYPNWNGICKERYYMPMITSRGCPYSCTFCHNVLGKKFRARSPENVLSEIGSLYQNYGVKEVHIVDDVFNLDVERAKRICSLIKDSGIGLSLTFPNGLRADIMSDELITLFKEAGTYNIHYGVETVTPRIQRMIKKPLDLERLAEVISKTARAGITTAGYFMLGFPGETRQEMLKTIDFAVNSDLDVAYFFKVTPYPDTELYRSIAPSSALSKELSGEFHTLHFYSVERSYTEMSARRLDDLILEAQQRFFLKPRRIWRALFKSPRRLRFLKNLVATSGLILQAYLVRKLTKPRHEDNP